MRAASFTARSRSASTTLAGALFTKPGLPSLLFRPSRALRFLSSSFWIRAFSFSRSTSSARGMDTRAAWVMTVTLPLAFSPASESMSATPTTVTSLA